MDYKVIVFPGQGSQKAGMGLDFVRDFPEAQAVFTRAQEVLNLDMIDLCRGDDGRIHLTEYTQPAILATEIAILAVLRNRYGVTPEWFGGHSLGEYTALVAAGVLPFEVALQVVRLRGKLMQGAVPPGIGKMVALVMDQLPVEEIKKAAALANIDVANDNSPSQVVLSGRAEYVDYFLEPFRKYETEGSLRIVPLETSAPFHSRLMKIIEDTFRNALLQVEKHIDAKKAQNVVSNWSGGFHKGDSFSLIEELVQQLSCTVKWQDNMKSLLAKNEGILEVGPDRTLRTFFHKIGVNISYLTDVRLLTKVFQGTSATESHLRKAA